jgi:glycosyltransferase involved in cell wall biosynthesis
VGTDSGPSDLVSVVIPARNEADRIASTVTAVLRQSTAAVALEVIVVDDGSTDRTAALAAEAGASVVHLDTAENGNPGIARNRGARATRGDPIVFLDADCEVQDDWLRFLLEAHSEGATIVGGSLELPRGLGFVARCDYYCGWYLIHPRAKAGRVPHHPPPNLSVRRKAFLSSSGFTEEPPIALSNEERKWQSELRRAGHYIYFEPSAVAAHANRPGLGQMLRRQYRWGYTAVESKSRTGSARLNWLYRSPALVVATGIPLALVQGGYILVCWLRVGEWEPLLMMPLIFLSRIVYGAGMTVGGFRWLRSGKAPEGRGDRTRVRW